MYYLQTYTGKQPDFAEYQPWIHQRFDYKWRWCYPADRPKVFVEIGTKVHLTDKEGMYTVQALGSHFARLTTKKWQYEYESGQRKTDYLEVPLTRIKCRAGGSQNTQH